VALTWTAATGATAYNVKRATSSSGPWTTVGTTADTAFVATGLTNGTLYYFVVSFTTTGGESLNSTAVSAKPLAPPAAPTGLKATGQVSQVYLAWSAASGATGYNIYRATTSGGGYVKVGTTTSRTYYDKLLPKGAYYCYVAKAYNANQSEGAPSNEVCATVQ
jgi:cellulose 1,4-beta-cellobiosidase